MRARKHDSAINQNTKTPPSLGNLESRVCASQRVAAQRKESECILVNSENIRPNPSLSTKIPHSALCPHCVICVASCKVCVRAHVSRSTRGCSDEHVLFLGKNLVLEKQPYLYFLGSHTRMHGVGYLVITLPQPLRL